MMRTLFIILPGFVIGVLAVHFFGPLQAKPTEEIRGLETKLYSNQLIGVVSSIDLGNRYIIIEGRDRSIDEKYKIKIFVEKNVVIKKIVAEDGGNETIFLASPEEIIPGKIVILVPIINNDGSIKVNSITVDSSPTAPLMPHV